MTRHRNCHWLTRREFTALIATGALSAGTRGDETVNDDQASPPRLQYENPQIQHWRIGLVLDTPVTCTNVFATFPVPMEWPEQKVRVIGQTIDPAVSRWTARELAGGAKLVVMQMARVTAGSTVDATFLVEFER